MTNNSQRNRFSTRSHQVRIIAGKWRCTPLTVLMRKGLRPTPDRVRETVFNWLEFFFERQWGAVRCLDLFAGSGALGFEAASRGADSILMLELDRRVFFQLKTQMEKLCMNDVTLIRADALTYLQDLCAAKRQFDLIFLDPPYQIGALPACLLSCEVLLSQYGCIYVESGMPLPKSEISNWKIFREGTAGAVYFSLLIR